MPVRLLRTPASPGAPVVEALSAAALMRLVRALSFPRPVDDEAAIARAAALVRGHLVACGHEVVEDDVGNLVSLPAGVGPVTLVCAHYDSVASTPGADDNASAVAVMIGIARAPHPPLGARHPGRLVDRHGDLSKPPLPPRQRHARDPRPRLPQRRRPPHSSRRPEQRRERGAMTVDRLMAVATPPAT